MKNKVLFLAGVLGSLVYVFNVILGAAITLNYSHIRNAVSELTQRGAPHIVVLSALFVLSAVFILIFGLVIMSSYRKSSKRVFAGGALIVLYSILAALMAAIFPQDPIGGQSTLAGTLHLVLAGLAAFSIMGAIIMIGLGLHQSAGTWQHFRLYSMITVALVFIFGASSPILIMNRIALLGLFERVTQLAYLQWFVVLALRCYAKEGLGAQNLPGNP